MGTQAVFAENINEPIIPAIAGLQTKAIVIGFAKNQYELGMAYYEENSFQEIRQKRWNGYIAQVKKLCTCKSCFSQDEFNGDGVVANPQLGLRLLQQAAQKVIKKRLKCCKY